MAAYAYFDQNGNLLEFISDKSLRQGNENAGNQILVFMEPEDFNYAGKSLVCNYKDVNTSETFTQAPIDCVQNVQTLTVPTFKDYDPTHFVSGKSYPFIVVDVPEQVLNQEGSKVLSLIMTELVEGALDDEELTSEETIYLRYKSVITFYVDPSVILFTKTISQSQFEYLLAKIGEIAGEVIELSHIIYKVNSKSDLGNYAQWNLNQCFFVLSDSDYSNHPVLLKRGASGYELLFDLANYYTKSEIESIRATLQDNIDAKQDKLTTALPTAQLQYSVGFDEQGNLSKGVGGGGGVYSAGTGIDITSFVISIDDSVVATKTFLSETYLSKSEASATYATKTELETVKKNAFIKVNTTTYPTLASFLLSTGEEGYIYLYPIDTTDLTKGYYQYIWEDNAWLDIGTTRIDLSNYVDLDSNQTITGQKTFSSEPIYNNGLRTTGINGISGSTSIQIGKDLIPGSNNTTDIGSSSRKWKDIYLSGQFKDGTNSVSVADIANGLFNVINASDIVNNTLTQAQFDLITNGKPTLILGTLTISNISFTNMLFLCENYSSGQSETTGTFIGYSANNNSQIRTLVINNTTGVLSLRSEAIKIAQGGSVIIEGKNANVYYLNNVYHYATLSDTQLKYEEINNITLSADTTYTLATAPNNTYPEYKGYITNSSASTKFITLPTSVTKIKASSSLHVVQPVISGGSVTVAGVVSIPGVAYVEFNISNGLALFVDWNE